MYLVEAGHEDEGISRNIDRETPLMSAVLCTAASAEDMVRLLAARFPRCIGWTNKAGLDGFQLAAQRGNDGMLTLLLSLSPNRVELLTHTSDDGNSALHFASAYGNMKCINTLVAAGADPQLKNDGGYTPIDYSSTVTAEVYFTKMVSDIERKQRDAVAAAVVENEIKTRRRGGSKPESATVMGPGGVRLVDQTSDAVARARSPSLKGMAAMRDTGSGRATPSGWRDNWALGLRGRAGSQD